MTSFRDSHRVLDNETSRAVLELERNGEADIEVYRPHIDGRGARNAYETGDVSRGMIDYGQAGAFVTGIETVESVFDRILDDASASLNTLRNATASIAPGAKVSVAFG